VLGFLSVSTRTLDIIDDWVEVFQSRAGFSECLDLPPSAATRLVAEFQSRAGFSECLDVAWASNWDVDLRFQSRAGFSECLDLCFSHTS